MLCLNLIEIYEGKGKEIATWSEAMHDIDKRKQLRITKENSIAIV